MVTTPLRASSPDVLKNKAASTLRTRSPDVLKNKASAEERRKLMRAQQGLSPRSEAASKAKSAKVYVSHLRAIEAAATKHFAVRGPPTAIGTNSEDLAWLENNKTAPGVVVLPCGLQYKVLKSAKSNARSPKVDIPVDVHYRGKLLSTGAEFYCSYAKTAEPERHVANRIIQGWTVALQLMGIGDKWMLYVPSELAYGDAGSTNGWKNIPPHAALTFELELIAVRSDAALPKVARPSGMSTDELIAAAATVSRPASAPATGDETDPVAVQRNADGHALPAKGGLFERSAVMVRRGVGGASATGLSDRSHSGSARPSAWSSLPTGHPNNLGANAQADRAIAAEQPLQRNELASLQESLAEAREATATHAARAGALSAENEELRASLERAVERARQWQVEAQSLRQQLGEQQQQQQTREEGGSGGSGDDLQQLVPDGAGCLPFDALASDELAVQPGAAPAATVILVGVTGGGKSSVGCALANKASAFGVSRGFSSATAAPAHVDYASSAAVVTRVVDTVGFHDTSLPADAAMRRFGSTFEAGFVPPSGADLFLFVLPFGRFSSASEAALQAFVACCGEAALEHTILVFTRCALSHDELKHELMASAPPSLRRVIPRLAFPSVLGVDVVAQPHASCQMLRTGVEEAIEALGGTRYSREAIEQAMEQYDGGQDEAERAAFAAAVSDWRKGGEEASS